MNIERHYTYRMMVRIRRDRPVKPDAEQLDGNTYLFNAGWLMGDGDPYPGEWAMIPDACGYPTDAPQWIASGDLAPLSYMLVDDAGRVSYISTEGCEPPWSVVLSDEDARKAVPSLGPGAGEG
jgi:hypothetical protein